MPKNFDPEIGKATRWKKGQSGNRGGRPRTATLSQAYREVLEQRVPGDNRSRTFAQVIAASVASAAADGNIRAAAELAERTEGRDPKAIAVPSPVDQEHSEYKYDHLTLEEIGECLIDRILQVEQLLDQQGLRGLLEVRRAAVASLNDYSTENKIQKAHDS
jgi:Family of unknown function (DUF5681)